MCRTTARATSSRSVLTRSALWCAACQNPFYTDIIHAIEQKLDASGYTMVMRQIPSGDDEIQVRRGDGKGKAPARHHLPRRTQSIIRPRRYRFLSVAYVCCSYTNSYGTLPPESYSSVSIADEQEAYRAVSELYKNGHRRIAALTAAPDDSSICSAPLPWLSAARCATSA